MSTRRTASTNKRKITGEYRQYQKQERIHKEDPTPREELIVCVMMVGLLLLVTITSLYWTSIGAKRRGGDYLYAVNDFDAGPVEELLAMNDSMPLQQATYPSFLHNTTLHRMVEFYAPWCGHCQHYRKKYVQIAKDIVNLTTSVTFHAVSCTVHRPLCKQQSVRGYPTVKFFKANSKNGTEINPHSHPFDILKKMDIIELDGTSSNGFNKNTNANNKNGLGVTDPSYLSSWRSIFASSTHIQDLDLVFADAWLSFDFNLRHGIFMDNSGPLSNETRKDFVDWMELLHMTLPPTWQIHDAINALRDNYDKVMDREEELLQILNQHAPPQKEWSRYCSGAASLKNDDTTTSSLGYTCGLWQLFHIISIGVVEWNLHSVATQETLVPFVVGEILKNFISNFFACVECKDNFLANYDACAYDGCNRLVSKPTPHAIHWQEVPLWLWETHNGVNVRLYQEHSQSTATLEQAQSAARWPFAQDCPKCWKDDGTSWNEHEVYKYLRIQYWPKDETSIKYRKQVLPQSHSPQRWLWFIQLLPLLALSVAGLWWYTKRLRRIKSGLHKKQEMLAR